MAGAMPVPGKHKPPKAGVGHKVANAYASTLVSVLWMDTGMDNGKGEDHDDEGIAHANGSDAMGKEGKDISGSRGTGGKLEASVPTLGAGDAFELRAPSATGGNPTVGSSCMVKITPNAPNLDHAKK